ncbi:hypothetical protein [Salegentibacter salegens]|nr:hypothetical protein [Salegentibacter salegens]
MGLRTWFLLLKQATNSSGKYLKYVKQFRGEYKKTETGETSFGH